mmetsp:Transcript_32940/g.49735  ORF Transcript_32940/g.49735 Transcript_32940/m.49735 type:complete len:229 (-) Transcript_32940:57-743(-)
MEQAICFNNQGIYYYEKGQLEKASACFRKALQAIKVFQEEFQLSPYIGCDVCNKLIRGWSKISATSTELAIEEGFSFPFCRTMLLEYCKETPVSPICLNIATLAILYNSAVVNHVYSNVHGQMSEAVEAAYDGYEHAFVILQDLGDIQNKPLSLHLQIVKAALFNNMGALFHNNYCRYRDAARCFRSYQTMMEVMNKQVLQNGFATTEELRQLSMNTLLVPITAAPSA